MRIPARANLVIICLLLAACAGPREASDRGEPVSEEVAAQQATYLEASRREHRARVEWHPMKRFAFDSADALDTMRIIDGQWEVRGGALHAVEGPENRTILLTVARWPIMRIAFDVILHGDADGQVGDIGIRLNADSETGAFRDGYAVILAQYRNQASVFYRRNIPYARTEWSPIEPGRRHHVVIEWTGRHMRAWVDDRIVLDAWDRGEPLAVGDHESWIGLHTWRTHMEVTNLVIYSDADAAASP